MEEANFQKAGLRGMMQSPFDSPPMYNVTDLPELDETTLKSQREVVKQAKQAAPRKTVSLSETDDQKDGSDAEEDTKSPLKIDANSDEAAAVVVTVSGCTGSTAKRVNGEYMQREKEFDHDGRSTYIGRAIDGGERVCLWYHGEKRAWMISKTSQIGHLTAYAVCKCTAETPLEIPMDENWLVYVPGAAFAGQKLRIGPGSPNVGAISQEESLEYMQFAAKEDRDVILGMYDVSNLPDLE